MIILQIFVGFCVLALGIGAIVALLLLWDQYIAPWEELLAKSIVAIVSVAMLIFVCWLIGSNVLPLLWEGYQ